MSTEVGKGHVSVSVDGSGMNEDIAKEVEKAAPAVEKAGQDQGDKFSKGFLDRIRGILGRNKGISQQLTGSGDGEAAGDKLGQDMIGGLRKRLEESHGVVQYLLDKLFVSQEQGKDPAYLTNLTRALRSATTDASLLERELRTVMKAEGLLDRVVSGNSSAGKKLGKDTGLTSLDNWLNGLNSRNNAVNILIKSMGGLIGAFDFLGQLAGKVFTTFATGFTQAADDASFLTKVMGGLAQFGASSGSAGAESGGGIIAGLGTIAASGPAIAAAIAVIVAGLTVFASILGAVIALVTAFAAAVASAFTGALLVAGAAMGAFMATAGLLVLAFKSMTDAQKKFFSGGGGKNGGGSSAGFAQIHQELVGIGQLMLGPILGAVHTWASNLQNALKGIVPLAAEMGRAFATAGTLITRSLSGPGFKAFETALATYLPGIVTKLAGALGPFLNGLLAIFSLLMPYVMQFAGYLSAVAHAFGAWANSAQGQNSIVTFVSMAVGALKGLWSAVSAIGQFIIAVFFSPQAVGAGVNIFTGIAHAFQGFTQDVQRAKADGSFQRWLDDGIKFGAALWSVIQALGGTFIALYNSGVITAITDVIRGMGVAINAVNTIISALADAVGPVFEFVAKVVVNSVYAIYTAISDVVKVIGNLLGLVGSVNLQNPLSGVNFGGSGPAPQTIIPGGTLMAKPTVPTMPQLNLSGYNALSQMSQANGGYMPNPSTAKPAYQNPYTAFANSLIAQGPSTQAQLRNAMLSLDKQAAAGIRSAQQSTGGSAGVISTLTSLMDTLRTGGAQAVNTAQQALSSAAQSLASASSAKAAAQALANVHRAQGNLQTALNYQAALNAQAKALNFQDTVSRAVVDRMAAGLSYSNATLADYAAARQILAARIAYYNQQLTAAISQRDNYATSVSNAAKTFADLTTAQARVVNGITQALTASDITSNLQTKLGQIKKFQNDLKLLLAQGLSNDAYKQIVDAGVVNGSTMADALLAGGSGAIQNTNSLVGQINGIATQLGTDASSRLYQAGVDAAKGLVDGLTSLSGQLDKAATKLGNAIAASIKKSLGIKSPSTVLRDMMGFVGDGAVLGLQDQHLKVGAAAATLAGLIAVNPGNGKPAAGGPVSGNADQRPIELTVVTPTKDPVAAGHEAINELVGRL